ncbi:sugar phosphate isomerase/epimerase [Lichenihabitans sp. PAMC28606]|uniref:sugar phosphate isomerase/epimerase family protein n=1 Tax=Lichenihabitans sp. PAMC28606 TaxID=2880932 RepID=UPI001D0B92BC|nr:sugar phosphate isomerase/epimerase [Lichenihabitans sp. PAMC28606]UDL93132.1 sugar phosphate isomerase/epimerase [Lichenihabitans sp. PAMC28606]
MPGWKLAYHANCWGLLGGNAVGVTSVTQLTYKTFGDMAAAARDIAAAGYEGIEFFDGNVVADAADGYASMRRILADTNLALVALYSGANFIFADIIAEELARVGRAADAAQALGAEHLVVGGGARRFDGTRPADYDALASALDKVVKIAEARGLRAQYHPHLSTIVENPDEVRTIFAKTGIGFCPDTAHLAAAGGDVAAIVREHAARISYVHLKGWQREPFAFTPVGVGDCDNGAVIRALHDIGYAGWICNELDSWPDPVGAARESHAFVTARAAEI